MTDTAEYIPKWPPNWTNARDDGFRRYSSCDSVLVQTEDVLRCAVSTSGITFVSIFVPIFSVFFYIVGWLSMDDHRERLAFMILIPFFLVFGFGLFYWLEKHHRSRGDYVVVDLSNRSVYLPRHGRTFSFDDIRCLQLLTGPDKNADVSNDSDLNLLVNEDGVVVRYHLMGNPLQEHARVIAQAMNTKLFEQYVPSGWYRSSDRQNKAVNGSRR